MAAVGVNLPLGDSVGVGMTEEAALNVEEKAAVAVTLLVREADGVAETKEAAEVCGE